MIFRAARLSKKSLSPEELKKDQKEAKHYGPCGLGEKAMYLNSFFIDRRYYIPYSSVQRVFKRVAMSKGGFSKRGVFASIPYLVVQYDHGQEVQCNFKDERYVDELMKALEQKKTGIPLLSKVQEERLREEEKRRAAIVRPEISERAKEERKRLQKAEDYLREREELASELSWAARDKRVFLRTDPSYKWVALAMTILGLIAFAYGIADFFTRRSGFDIYIVLFGMALSFLFAGFSTLPTARNNRKSVFRRMERAEDAVKQYISAYPNFPLPVRYAHPDVLRRMGRAIEFAHAEDSDSALRYVKEELKAVNSSVEVDQRDYDEIVAIKALFLNADYL